MLALNVIPAPAPAAAPPGDEQREQVQMHRGGQGDDADGQHAQADGQLPPRGDAVQRRLGGCGGAEDQQHGEPGDEGAAGVEQRGEHGG